jgi:hypothetical protein
MPPIIPYLATIRDACAKDGCPLCRLEYLAADKYIDGLLWDAVNEPALRGRIDNARGFCNAHGWRLVRRGAALGVAIMTRGVVHTLLQLTDNPEQIAGSPSLWQRLGRADGNSGAARLATNLQPQEPCLICAHVAVMKQEVLRTTSQTMTGDHGLAMPLANSDGLCLDHLRQVLALAPPDEAAALLKAQRTVWQRLKGQLDEFIRKADHRFHDESYGIEADSWERALANIVGASPARVTDRGLTQAFVNPFGPDPTVPMDTASFVAPIGDETAAVDEVTVTDSSDPAASNLATTNTNS